MKEKIDWYQEVLDLEPGSKVFFPLAKLLTQNNELLRAIETLQHGLERHPEFIEARLYLVDLLHQNSEIKGNKERLEQHLAFLIPLLERYAGFWQAWGSTQKGDSALAIAFLAAVFKDKGLTLSQVFTKGLQSFFDGNKSNFEPGGQSGLKGDNFTLPNHNLNKDVELESEIDTDVELEISREQQVAPTIADNVAEAISALAEQAQGINNTEPYDDMLDEDEEGEERFSLRTRSMAEVLAEQGDYAGALEIYQELISNATSSQEKEDLQYRINTLSAYISSAQEKTIVDEDVTASSGQNRVMSVLEILAGRLENRVNS